MAPLYQYCIDNFGWKQDTGLLNSLVQKNQQVVKDMDVKIQDAVDNLGETEHSDALIAKANYLAKIGEKVIIVFILGFGHHSI